MGSASTAIQRFPIRERVRSIAMLCSLIIPNDTPTKLLPEWQRRPVRQSGPSGCCSALCRFPAGDTDLCFSPPVALLAQFLLLRRGGMHLLRVVGADRRTQCLAGTWKEAGLL